MIRNVQALRAVAAILVVITHLDALLMSAGLPHGVLAFGTAGVDLFFVVSGFVMVYATSQRQVGSVSFMKDRIIRVVPLYWALTLLLYAGASLLPDLMPTTPSSPVDLLRSLLFLPYTKANGEIHPVLFLGWTLNYEMFFYLIFALSMLVSGMIARAIFVSVVIVMLVVAGAMVDRSQTAVFFYTRPIMLEFAAGVWIGVSYIRGFRLTGVRPRCAWASAQLSCWAASHCGRTVSAPGGAGRVRR